MSEHGSPCWYEDQSPFIPDLESPNQSSNPTNLASYSHQLPYGCKKELDLHYQQLAQEHFLQLPLMENPKLLLTPFGLDVNQSTGLQSSSSLTQEQNLQQLMFGKHIISDHEHEVVDPVTDWRVLDKFVASQLSHEVAPNTNTNGAARESGNRDVVSDDASMQTSASCEMELWK